ncbi:MAG: endonuclease III [Nitrososphaerota archaeon]|nr:endonuclease III [Nitrososphaerota archaeon]
MDIERILESMAKMVGEDVSTLEWISQRRDPFQVLISTIISSRTKDEITREASKRLFGRYKDAYELSQADERDIERLIKPAGFYRVKARRIKEVAQMIVKNFGGKVPSSIEDLLTLPSVGRKTANCVLVYGFGKPAIPVDTHVHRIANRLGLVDSKVPEETEYQLMEKVKREYWIQINELFVKFGQRICQPIKPRCDICSLTSICKWYRSKGKSE